MPKIVERKSDPVLEFHKRMFVGFAKWEIASGGPDPHMKMAEYFAVQGEDPLWMAGCYTAPYVVSTAVAISDHWSRAAVLKTPAKFSAWVLSNWDHLPIRKERRVNGTGPAKLAEILICYAKWLNDGGLERIQGMPFKLAFEKMDPLHYGRYFKMKLYEVIRRILVKTESDLSLPEMTDILPKNGSHPRKGLAILYPKHQYKSNKVPDLEEANDLSDGLRDLLRESSIEVDWFVIEVLLCNYRQAVNGGQYPGRAHDSELGHLAAVSGRFPVDKILQCRKTLFKPRFLGEIGQKWAGRRLELGKVMMAHKYVWSDQLYNYPKTTDLANPVRW